MIHKKVKKLVAKIHPVLKKLETVTPTDAKILAELVVLNAAIVDLIAIGVKGRY